MSQSAVWSMGTITFEGKIPVSDREDTYLWGMGRGIGGSPKTLRNLKGWSTWNLTFPYRGRYMVQKRSNTPLRN